MKIKHFKTPEAFLRLGRRAAHSAAGERIPLFPRWRKKV